MGKKGKSMGRSNEYIIPFYHEHIKPEGKTALLGFSENSIFEGDLYDLSLGNWNINDDWHLNKKYDTIICTRCAYFAKDPQGFILKCMNHLEKNGTLYVDWGLGDHWRFENYKIGWVKDGEHEYAYANDNFLWSAVWSDKFLNDDQFKLFEKRVQKFGYNNVKDAIKKEVPSVLMVNYIEKQYTTRYYNICLWDDLPQLYTLLSLTK
jgi:hypothetical protein